MKSHRAITTLIACTVGGGGIAGCSDPRAAAPTRTRLDRIDHCVEVTRDRERDGHRRLAVMADLIERDARWHDAHLSRDLRRLREWSERDVQRWYDRQPRYRADLEDIWNGNLELADEMIPRLFY